MVDVEEVEDIAENARIELQDGEAEKFAEEFEEILDTFNTLEKIDTEDVEPAFHPVDTDPEAREDEVEQTLGIEEVFRNTQNVEEEHFKGPSV
ncbi:MAG: Asp-tRNA(Asn)/Glu-tRNA(Gln) amidotransferase subunit GatC [Candidatus Nanohaloarchaea archaeon]